MKTKTPVKYLRHQLLIVAGLAFLPVANLQADYHSTVLSDAPVAYYPINSSVDPTGTTATDLSGNGNNGVYNSTDPEFNTVSGPSASIPTALFFDGVFSYVDLSGGGNLGLLNFSGPITMEAWVQPANSTQGPANIIAKGYDSSQTDNELVLRANAGNYYGGTFSDTNGVQGASGGQQTTDWTYVVSTYDGTNWHMYVNSILVQSNPDSFGAINFSDPWAIGTGTASGAARYFSGNLTEVALYTNALTSAQVLNHFCVGELGTPSASSIPIITTQPQSLTAAYGTTASFSVVAVSALSTTNQWYKNNVAMAGQTNATLTLANVGIGDAVNYRVVVGNANGITNSTSVSLTVVAANSLKWDATAGSSDVWDTGTTANWLNVSNSTQTVFSSFDQVLFDDTVGVSNNVTINGTVSPSLITVNSSTNNFTFAQGSSTALSGTGSLVKKGSSQLTIYAPSGFAGAVSVQGGTVYAGNNSFHNVGSIVVTNNATLDLAGGSTSGGQTVTVSGSGVGGVGSLYNSYSDGNSELYNIVLAGDTTFGCASGAVWGLQGGSTISGKHKLTVKWGNSGDYTEWNGVIFSTNLGDIELASGKLGIKNMGSNFGNSTNTFTVDGGAELDFWTSDFGYAKNYHVLGGGKYQVLTSFTTLNANYVLEDAAQFNSFWGSGTQTITGTVQLNGVAHFVLGDANYVFPNVFSGTGGILWDAYNHQMILKGTNTYTGPTVIGDGQTLALTGNGSIAHSSLIFFGGSNSNSVHLDASGRSDSALTLASGQTLGGIGAVAGNLVEAAGATIAPAGTNTTISITTGANPVGSITATGNITLNGTTVIKLNGSGVNDNLHAGGNLTYGGTLSLANISGTSLAAGDTFQLFSAGGSISGSFASITPTTPGSGLAWNTSQLSSGVLSVVSGAPSGFTNVVISGTNIIVSGNGGSANGTFYVLTATNLVTPLANWVVLSTNSYDSSGNFRVTNPVTAGTPQRFYRIKQ